MQDFIEKITERLQSEELQGILEFHSKLCAVCDDEEKQKLLKRGEQNTIIILPLELDSDMVFAGLILPLLRQNKIDANDFAEYSSAFELANSVLSIENVDIEKSDDENIEKFRSMLVAMAKDIRVIILKLASELNNFRHIKKLSEEEQKKLHEETVDLYVPLASRLGLSYIKSELQDLDLSYTNPNEYKKLLKLLAEDNKIREIQMEKVRVELSQILKELGINGDIQARIKHVSSIYNKLHQKNYTINQLYDLLAMRVLVNNVNECYSVLGAVHTKYMPLDGRFKDYIARPKLNGYQSLHTTVLVEGKPLEIQIRTFEMHNHAEYGIAAHFLYKEKKNRIDNLDSRLLSIRKILENPNISSNQDLINELKTDVYSGEIFVQTPKGKILELPEFSTPVDFAYAIHSNIGNTCVGAKVNGKMVPLNKQLNNADVVEIITSANAKGPSKDWLSFVKSAGAKNKINQFFKKNDREDNIKKGKSMLEQSAKVKDVDLKVYMDDRWLDSVLSRYSLKNVEDMYAMIGCGAITTTQILNKLIAGYQQFNEEQKNEFVFKPSNYENQNKDVSSISELRSMLIKYAQCCNPVPGDEIIGFVSRGRGVTIHRKNCKAVKYLDADRLMPLSWNKSAEKTANFVANIQLLVKDANKMIANIVNKIAEQKISIVSINSKKLKDGDILIDIKVSITDKNAVEDLMNKLKNIANVYDVKRGNWWLKNWR